MRGLSVPLEPVIHDPTPRVSSRPPFLDPRPAEAEPAKAPAKNRPRGDIDPKKVAADYRAGLSTSELVAKYQCTPGTIRSRLLAANVTMRPPGRPPKARATT